MSQIKVGVLRGGPSHAYDDSLRSGGYILSLLREMPETYEPLDIFVSKEGEWHLSGLVDDPHKILSRADVVWNAMRGHYGEDGQVQTLLENLQVPFVGSTTLASSLAYNKEMSKALYQRHLLPTPEFFLVSQEDFSDDKLIEIFRGLMHPVIVKPSNGARALGVRIAHTFQELKDAVKKTFPHSPKVLVEEYVRGAVSSCTVIEDAKGEKLYALVPSGRQPVETNKKIEMIAKKAHEVLNQRHISSSDFIITPRGKIYILETNSVPLLHEDSHLHHTLHSTGWRPKDFVDHCIKMTLGNV